MLETAGSGAEFEVRGTLAGHPFEELVRWALNNLSLAGGRPTEFPASIGDCRFVVEVSAKFAAHYSSEDETIVLSTGAFELYWAASRFYFLLLRHAEGKKNPEDSKKEAAEVYRWAIARLLDRSEEPWPFSKPDVCPAYWQGAIFSVLFHEIGHHAGKHEAVKIESDEEPNSPNRSWALMQEKEADSFASDWLSSPGQEDYFRFGGVVAHAVALLLQLLIRKVGRERSIPGQTHPLSSHRLYNSIMRTSPDESSNSVIWLSVILRWHLTLVKEMPELPNGCDLKTGVDLMMDRIEHLLRPTET